MDGFNQPSYCCKLKQMLEESSNFWEWLSSFGDTLTWSSIKKTRLVAVIG